MTRRIRRASPDLELRVLVDGQVVIGPTRQHYRLDRGGAAADRRELCPCLEACGCDE